MLGQTIRIWCNALKFKFFKAINFYLKCNNTNLILEQARLDLSGFGFIKMAIILLLFLQNLHSALSLVQPIDLFILRLGLFNDRLITQDPLHSLELVFYFFDTHPNLLVSHLLHGFIILSDLSLVFAGWPIFLGPCFDPFHLPFDPLKIEFYSCQLIVYHVYGCFWDVFWPLV